MSADSRSNYKVTSFIRRRMFESVLRPFVAGLSPDLADEPPYRIYSRAAVIGFLCVVLGGTAELELRLLEKFNPSLHIDSGLFQTVPLVLMCAGAFLWLASILLIRTFLKVTNETAKKVESIKVEDPSYRRVETIRRD